MHQRKHLTSSFRPWLTNSKKLKHFSILLARKAPPSTEPKAVSWHWSELESVFNNIAIQCYNQMTGFVMTNALTSTAQCYTQTPAWITAIACISEPQESHELDWRCFSPVCEKEWILEFAFNFQLPNRTFNIVLFFQYSIVLDNAWT